MIFEEAKGTTVIDDVKHEYEVTLELPGSDDENAPMSAKEAIKEYRQWLQDGIEDKEHVAHGRLGKDESIDDAVLKAIVDYERRTQRAKARPSKSGGTGVKKYQTAISQALKSGQVSDEEIQKALAAAGISLG